MFERTEKKNSPSMSPETSHIDTPPSPESTTRPALSQTDRLSSYETSPVPSSNAATLVPDSASRKLLILFPGAQLLNAAATAW